MLLASATALAVLASAVSAGAAPGEVSSKVQSFPKFGENGAVWPYGRAIIQRSDGSYLAFADTAIFLGLDNATLFDELSTLKVTKVSSGGKLSRTFARSQIGKGVRIGRKHEVSDPETILQVPGNNYVAWLTTDGYTGGSHYWPRSTMVAFNASSGRLVKSFGKDGVMVFGQSWKSRGEVSQSDATDAAVLGDGRVLTCGQALLRSRTSDGIGIVPFANVAGLTSPQATGFFEGGVTYLIDHERQAGIHFRNCARLSVLPDGRILMIGIQGKYGDESTYRTFLSMWTENGSRVTSFGLGGETVLDSATLASRASQLRVSKSIPAPDGGIYLSGRLVRGTAPRGFVLKMRIDGSIESTYGTDGVTWVDGFRVEDASIAPNGGLLLTGTRPDKYSAAGWLDAVGKWDPNFYGSGWHAYRETWGDPDTYQLSSGSRAKIFQWMPRAGLCSRCMSSGIATLDNQLRLDSSILIADRSGSTVKLRGIAASPNPLVRVEVGVSRSTALPTSWVAATGTHSWSATLSATGRKPLYVFSRATDDHGGVETAFTTSSRNRLRLARQKN